MSGTPAPTDADRPGDDVARVRAALTAPAAPALHLPLDRFLAALADLSDEVARRHRELGLSPETSRETLADVPRKLAAYPATIDVGWLLGVARADVVSLGRLQFERTATAEGRAVHVPETGPLEPAAVDASLARAAAVFGGGVVSCTSWLLDPLLADVVPGSNLAAFARRFALGPVVRDVEGDHVVAKFVFRRPLAEVLDPGLVTPRTRVERFVAAHLREGGHWSEPRGTLTLP